MSSLVRTVSVSSDRKRRRTKSGLRRAPKKISLARSMKSPLMHTFIRQASINQTVSTAGFVWQVGIVPSGNFSIWFTNQNAYIWASASNYSTVAIPGYADLAALFDEVKIAAVEITIIAANDPNIYGSNGSGVLCFAKDFNDHNAPSGTGDVQQYADCKAYNPQPGNPIVLNVTPKFLTYSLDSAGVPVASSPTIGFVRSNLDIEHNALKGSFLLSPPGSGQYVFTFKYKYICKVSK